MTEYLFTSESVSEGHPDKIADQISDAILDEIIIQDTKARVACETYIKTGIIIVGGEITTTAKIDIEELIRNTIRDIGYIHSDVGFDADSCIILNVIGKQSTDIFHGINLSQENLEDQCAGDQGSMFGYATNETDIFMPAPIAYAHRLMEQHAKIRKEKILSWLRPDAKCQITFVYNEKRKIVKIHSIVFSTQHVENVSLSEIKEGIVEEIIKPTLPKKWLNSNTKYYINPTNRFVIGGPTGDCGLTGRKIIVDTYGGMARHGGGAFSGKDPSKMDRSASYYARYVAKNIVAAGLAERFEIQVSYAIGMKEPVSLSIETFGTEKISINDLMNLINYFFDFRPQNIISSLNLLRPIYKKTATYGHFGREIFPWENLDKMYELKEFSKNKHKI